MKNKNSKKDIKDSQLLNPKMAYDEDDGEVNEQPPSKKDTKKKSNSSTPILDTYGKDLTKMANDGKLDAIVGRVKEIDRIAQILCRRKKNNPVIIGESGCVDENTLITIRKVSETSAHEIVVFDN